MIYFIWNKIENQQKEAKMDKNELAGSFSLVLVLFAIAYVFKSSAAIYSFIFSVFFAFSLVDKNISPFMKVVMGISASIFLLCIRLA